MAPCPLPSTWPQLLQAPSCAPCSEQAAGRDLWDSCPFLLFRRGVSQPQGRGALSSVPGRNLTTPRSRRKQKEEREGGKRGSFCGKTLQPKCKETVFRDHRLENMLMFTIPFRILCNLSFKFTAILVFRIFSVGEMVS